MKLPDETGFTLLELLIVVAVIGILAAIAIPSFNTYRIRSYNAAAISDLANSRYAQEAMYSEAQDYGAASSVSSVLILVGATAGNQQSVPLSTGVSVGAKTMTSSGRNVSYTVVAKHLRGDSAFGVETESQGEFRRPMNPNLALSDADIPAATAIIDFVSPWGPAQ